MLITINSKFTHVLRTYTLTLPHSLTAYGNVADLQRTTHKKYENYKLDKPNKSLKMTRGFTSFIEAQAKQT